MTRFAFALCLLALLGSLGAKEIDFAKGETTWLNAKVGDWVEIKFDAGLRQRIDVIDVSGGKVATETRNWAAGSTEPTVRKDKVVAPRDKKPIGSKLPLDGKTQIKWSDVDYTAGGVVLKCRQAEWTIDKLRTVMIYCKDVPCGGFVATLTGGGSKPALELVNWGTAEKPEGFAIATGNTAKLPPFATKVGAKWVVKETASESGKVISESYFLYEIVSAEQQVLRMTETPCDKTGKPTAGATARSVNIAADMHPANTGKKGATEKLKTEAGEFDCVIHAWQENGVEVKGWLTAEGMIVRKAVPGERSLEIVVVKLL